MAKSGRSRAGVGNGESLLVGMSSERAVHRSNTGGQADTDNDPWVGSHESVAPSAAVKSLSCYANHADAEASV